MIYDVSEASNIKTFEARGVGLGLQKACQKPTESTDMKSNCVKAIALITMVNATFVFQAIEISEPELKYQ